MPAGINIWSKLLRVGRIRLFDPSINPSMPNAATAAAPVQLRLPGADSHSLSLRFCPWPLVTLTPKVDDKFCGNPIINLLQSA